MNKNSTNLPPSVSLAALLDASVESKQEDSRRRHLGGSMIGRKCERELWYSFRWVKRFKHKARLLRLFGRGHHEEVKIVKEFREAGIVVHEFENPETETQFRVSSCGGHFGGSLDAILENIPEDIKKKHLGEFKTANDSNFKQMCKKGVKLSKPVYWYQMQVYMFLKGLERAIFYMVNKNTDDTYIERIKFNLKDAEKMIAKAQRIIFSPVPPPPIDEYQSGYDCTYCDYKAICANEAVAEINCRTCSAVTPGDNKTWNCARYSMDVQPNKKQRIENELNNTTDNDKVGCSAHTFIPALIEPHIKLIATDKFTNAYTTAQGEYIENGPNGLTSAQLKTAIEENKI